MDGGSEIEYSYKQVMEIDRERLFANGLNPTDVINIISDVIVSKNEISWHFIVLL
jgi:hypothetical protein